MCIEICVERFLQLQGKETDVSIDGRPVLEGKVTNSNAVNMRLNMVNVHFCKAMT